MPYRSAVRYRRARCVDRIGTLLTTTTKTLTAIRHIRFGSSRRLVPTLEDAGFNAGHHDVMLADRSEEDRDV